MTDALQLRGKQASPGSDPNAFSQCGPFLPEGDGAAPSPRFTLASPGNAATIPLPRGEAPHPSRTGEASPTLRDSGLAMLLPRAATALAAGLAAGIAGRAYAAGTITTVDPWPWLKPMFVVLAVAASFAAGMSVRAFVAYRCSERRIEQIRARGQDGRDNEEDRA